MRFNREKVPEDIAEKARTKGVIQKDSQGRWRIISLKTNPPEYWNSHYETKEKAQKALEAYHAHRGSWQKDLFFFLPSENKIEALYMKENPTQSTNPGR